MGGVGELDFCGNFVGIGELLKNVIKLVRNTCGPYLNVLAIWKAKTDYTCNLFTFNSCEF